jgi:hypothetical protein
MLKSICLALVVMMLPVQVLAKDVSLVPDDVHVFVSNGKLTSVAPQGVLEWDLVGGDVRLSLRSGAIVDAQVKPVSSRNVDFLGSDVIFVGDQSTKAFGACFHEGGALISSISAAINTCGVHGANSHACTTAMSLVRLNFDAWNDCMIFLQQQ